MTEDDGRRVKHRSGRDDPLDCAIRLQLQLSGGSPPWLSQQTYDASGHGPAFGPWPVWPPALPATVGDEGPLPLVSIVTPVRDGAAFLAETIASVVACDYAGPLEWVVFDDGSRDGSGAMLEAARSRLAARGVVLVILGGADTPSGRGCCYGKNRALEAATGTYACFLDADDAMATARVTAQVALAKRCNATSAVPTLVGCNLVRSPAGATVRYAAWLNGLTAPQLRTQWLRETTLAMPTWFARRSLFLPSAGGRAFDEDGGHNNGEDLSWLLSHCGAGGALAKVAGAPLVLYRYHSASSTATRGVPSVLLWRLRITALESQLLTTGIGPNVIRSSSHLVMLTTAPWRAGFTIWNAGKEGRRLYRSLCATSRAAVKAFCDVDEAKIATGFYAPPPLLGGDGAQGAVVRVPIIHWTTATPPLLLCVKGDLTGGAFEANLASLNLREGIDYIHFS